MSETNAERLERIKEWTYEDEDINWLIEQAERVQNMEKENQWLYGRLNLISDIIEEGRRETERGETE